MASNPLFIIPDFFCFFPMNFGMASWVLLENAKKNLVFYFGGGHHAFFPQKPVVKCLSQKLQKCIYSNLQPGCLVVRRLSTFTYWCIKMNRSSLNFSPSNQYIFLLFFLLPFDKWIKHWKKSLWILWWQLCRKFKTIFFCRTKGHYWK